MRNFLLVAGFLAMATAVARAQPGGDPPPDPTPGGPPPMASNPPAATPPPAATTTAGVDQGVLDDANATGSFILPTALTEPAGMVSATLTGGADRNFKTSELTTLSLAYAATKEFTLSGTVVLPTENFREYALSGKFQVVRANRLRVALQGNLLFASSNNTTEIAGVVGGIGTLCFDDACNSHASGLIEAGIEHSSGSGVPILISGGIAIQVAPHFKLVGEAITGFIAGDHVASTDNAFVGIIGARVTSPVGAINVGFANLYGAGSTPGVFIASLTGRIRAM